MIGDGGEWEWVVVELDVEVIVELVVELLDILICILELVISDRDDFWSDCVGRSAYGLAAESNIRSGF